MPITLAISVMKIKKKKNGLSSLRQNINKFMFQLNRREKINKKTTFIIKM